MSAGLRYLAERLASAEFNLASSLEKIAGLEQQVADLTARIQELNGGDQLQSAQQSGG